VAKFTEGRIGNPFVDAVLARPLTARNLSGSLMRKPSFSPRTLARLGLTKVTITTSAADRDLLEAAAQARGISARSLAASIVHAAVSFRMVDSILGDK
jgi:hypothetical protein